MSRHIKGCVARNKEALQSNEPAPSINTNCSINGGNNNTINGVVNNISLVVYNHNDPESFKKDHISYRDLKDTLKIISRDINDEKKVCLMEQYTRQLISNPDNRCIKKTNMRDVYSRVHVGNNNWVSKSDKDIYPKLTCNIAEGLNDLIGIRNAEQRMIKANKLKELSNFLEYMTDNGYRNDEDEEINHHTQMDFKEIVKRIKAVVFDITKIHL